MDSYDKYTMESFALKTLTYSFNSKYGEYFKPINEDNFDYISPDKNIALEVTSVRTKNEIEIHKYEKAKAKGKSKLKTGCIKDLKLDNYGNIKSYYGGSINELVTSIQGAIDEKQKKALKRLKNKPYKMIDLCLCIDDGGMLDIFSFEIGLKNLDRYIFRSIFFITSNCFIYYNKESDFE